MLFTETSEIIIGHLHSLIFVFTADETFLTNFFDWLLQQGMYVPLFGAY